jgi:phosphoglycolate phosphatase
MRKLIIWDWNGTLINDVDISIDSMNTLLKRCGYERLLSEAEYKKIFSIPVIDYYKKVGFDFKKHPFELVGQEFIDIYNSNFYRAELQKNTIEVLSEIKKAGLNQIVISAREHNALYNDLRLHNICDFFDEILGISDNYAAGKEALFEKYLSENQYDDKKFFLIGDTFHDFHIARKFQLNFVHFSHGHQDKTHFSGFEIVSIYDLNELLSIVI